ncbi:YopX family protein [Enterococcus gallinarum]|uniref:YopX family protein n=1 Tax=Enterococcus gallinarum TaxID=1353 RepID=UPI0029552AD1|nr:YopX family protein [Enterococcus gallinarum]MDV7874496.1 YopX family protein [Enterococcus gallinarum]
MVTKFRAFLTETKTIHHVLQIDLSRSMVSLKIENASEWYWFKEVVLMQSTGLKDKNGVEIFEGDIVKVTDEDEAYSYISVVKNYAEEGYPAFDIEYPSDWDYESNVLSTIMGGDYETIEVIGNVWENPNLLEQTYEN